ncbi:MAG: hypothetical protein SGCHY_005102 [Lobulomycetales sp.]
MAQQNMRRRYQVDLAARKVMAAADLRTEELVYQTDAMCLSLLDSSKKRVCCVCLKANEDDGPFHLFCARCDTVYFCSLDCLTKSQADSAHYLICPAICEIVKAKIPAMEASIIKLVLSALVERARAMDRLLGTTPATASGSSGPVFYFRPTYTSRAVKDNTQWDTLKRLDSQYNLLDKQQKMEWQRIKSFVIPFALKTGLVDDLRDEDARRDMIFDLLSKIESNCFGICAFTKQSVVGRALFPLASFFNHSCAPNCVLEQKARSVHIRALKEIFEGEELSLSYIPGVEKMDYTTRTQQLAQFFISCKCVRCMADSAAAGVEDLSLQP